MSIDTYVRTVYRNLPKGNRIIRQFDSTVKVEGKMSFITFLTDTNHIGKEKGGKRELMLVLKHGW